jgi:chitinase
MRTALLLSCCALRGLLHAQGPNLIGYWHNWNDASAPYIPLDQVDPAYSVIEVAFAEPAPGTSHYMVFTPAGATPQQFAEQVAYHQSNDKRVLLSIGGANASVHLDSDAERDEFVSTVLGIIAAYGFDGIDIDLEGSSVAITGGTIASPTDAAIIRLIDAVNAIGDAFEVAYVRPMMLTMAPESAYVQGGMSAFGGIWGAYLPIIHALRDRIDILQVQLYNSGTMYGIDGGIYTQGTADFIVSQTEAVIQGFNTAGGFFAGLPAHKVAVGLPACPSAAGGGYASPAVVGAAVGYLRGLGGQPGSYQRVAAYPDLRGLMTWSINWDAAPGCAGEYTFAQTYAGLFNLITAVPAAADHALPWQVLVDDQGLLLHGAAPGARVEVFDAMGRRCMLTLGTGMALRLPVGTGAWILRVTSRDGVSAQRAVVPAP